MIYLHSTMLLLIRVAAPVFSDEFQYLHSTMLLLILVPSYGKGRIAHIYIPLCFYLYHGRAYSFFRLCQFTFHYASTYTTYTVKYNANGGRFTFHYASTYTVEQRKIVKESTNLHSTMLLLILEYVRRSCERSINLHSTMLLLIR